MTDITLCQHFCTTETSLYQTSPYARHFSKAVTSLIQTSPSARHFSETDISVHQTPLYTRHFSTADTSLSLIPVWCLPSVNTFSCCKILCNVVCIHKLYVNTVSIHIRKGYALPSSCIFTFKSYNNKIIRKI